jgi:ATP diphosphatase
MTEGSDIRRLLEVMAKLRDPENGCPWDVEQTFGTIAPYTIEEAYEVADAIERGDMEDLKGELGDLLFQVVFHGRMAEEAGHFSFNDIAAQIADKMISRHPHVFGDQSGIDSATDQTLNWEAQKAKERAEKARADGRRESALDGVALGLPALTRAEKLQKRAARVGFDFPDLDPVVGKIEEELAEVRTELLSGDHARQEQEIGDLLFAVTNLARFLKIDPEAALRATNQKFISRFEAVEDALHLEGRSTESATLEEMDRHWNAAKKRET